jgi:hypothetical protein
MLRKNMSAKTKPATASAEKTERMDRTALPASDADHIFDRFEIAKDGKDWQMGTVDIDIIHRGRIRIATHEWPPVIMYCKSDLTEEGIVKQFRLHVLRYSHDVTLVYGTYRFKQEIAKAWLQDHRCGKIVDAHANIRETTVNLAFWLTAQQHAEKSFPTWAALIAEAMTKLSAAEQSSAFA